VWPAPVTTYFVEVSSGRPIGPRACSFCVEIGISTQKLHARGPMGLPELTSTKYVVTGAGHTR